MSIYKPLLLIVMLSFLLFFSCKKEEENEGITRADFYGNYSGKKTSSPGNWSINSFRITEAPIGETYITITGITRYSNHQLIANTKQEEISIKEQSFHVDQISPGGVHSVYDAIYFGSGSLDTTKHEIIFHYTEKQVFKDTTYVMQWVTTGIRQ